MLPTVLDSIRSLLCTSTGETPHARFFGFNRRSHYGSSLPEWLCKPGPVLLRKFVRTGKTDDLVQKVDLIEANPMYARIRYRDGRETNVSLRDLARYPREAEAQKDFVHEQGVRKELIEGREVACDEGRDVVAEDVIRSDDGIEEEGGREVQKDDDGRLLEGDETIDKGESEKGGDRDVFANRRVSTRINKGVPPERFGFP